MQTQAGGPQRREKQLETIKKFWQLFSGQMLVHSLYSAFFGHPDEWTARLRMTEVTKVINNRRINLDPISGKIKRRKSKRFIVRKNVRVKNMRKCYSG